MSLALGSSFPRCHACHAKSRVPRLPRKMKVDVTKCQVPRLSRKVPRRHRRPSPPKRANQCHKCHACHAKRRRLCVKVGVFDQVLCESWRVWKLVCDKVLCDKVVLKDGVWQSCVSKKVWKLLVFKVVSKKVWKLLLFKVGVWQSCVWKLVCDKVVCERWYVTRWYVTKMVCDRCCVKDGASQSCVWKMVCDKDGVWQAGGGRRWEATWDTESKTRTPHKVVGKKKVS